MRNAVFRERALVEGARYAKDKMVFLRELCQNARDGGATEVRVTVSSDGEDCVLDFEDNGCGMTFSHAERFLFTLYASSKENDADNAGKFGVGFWSILLSSPRLLGVESRSAGAEPWKVIFNRELEVQRVKAEHLTEPGTRITLRYGPGQFSDRNELFRRVERALFKYCRHLRKNTDKGGALPILLNGERVDRPFAVEGPHYMTFDEGGIQGAVGLAETPSVSVFARGLLVWQGTSLDELRYGAARRRKPPRIRGLAPCFVLNGDRLNATLDRRAVIDDNALARLRKTAAIRMDEFVERYMDQVSPPRILTRISRQAARRYRAAGRSTRLAVWGALLAVAALLSFGIWAPKVEGLARFFSMPKDVPTESAPETKARAPLMVPLRNGWSYEGPTVGGGYPEAAQLSFAYRPAVDVGFRIAAMDVLDPGRGIVPSAPALLGPYEGGTCADDCLYAALTAEAESGVFALPLPTGYRLVDGSVRLNGRSPETVYVDRSGDPVVRLSSRLTGQITYTAAPSVEGLSGQLRSAWLLIPPQIELPKVLVDAARQCETHKTVKERVDCAEQFAAQTVAYDDSRETVEAYRRFYSQKTKRGWFEFVLRERRGDCDVLNALVTVLLREMGIPARLVAGPLGRDGVAEPGMHAWVEYESNGVHTADAVATAPASAPATQRRTASAGVPPIALDTEQASASEAVNSPDVSVPSVGAPLIESIGKAFWGVLAGALLMIVALWWSAGPQGGLHLSGEAESRRKDAAKMVAAAMAESGLWRDGKALLSRRLLKVHGRKRRISMRAALRSSEEGRLYASEDASALTRMASAHRIPVLDITDPVFGELVHQLPGVIHLDEIEDLAPMSAKDLPRTYSSERRLLALVEQILDACGLSGMMGIRISLAPDLFSVRDISLPGILFRPRHLVVVPVGGKLIREALDSSTNETRAAAVLLQGLATESDLIYEVREMLSAEAARRVFEVCA